MKQLQAFDKGSAAKNGALDMCTNKCSQLSLQAKQ